MKIAITVGHSILKDGTCTSAGGFVKEYAYCKELAPILASKLKNNGCNVNTIVCPERQFTKASDEKNFKLNLINGKKYDLVVELHLNAYNGTAKGTEVLYCSNRGKVYAQRINDRLDDIFTDRDIKYRNDLYILNGTDCAAVLVEAFFCDNKEDYNKADEAHEKDLIATKIAEGILNKTLEVKKEKYENCILFDGDVDEVGAKILSWYMKDCIVKDVYNHIAWEGYNLYVVGGPAKIKLDNMNTGEKYTSIVGKDRIETTQKCLDFRK